MYQGDIGTAQTLYFNFSTQFSGAPTTLAGTPVLKVFKDDGTAGTTTGPTLTVDFAAITGLNNVKITTTDAFYAAAHDYSVVLSAGNVGGVSAIGYKVASFSIQNRYAASSSGGTVVVSGGTVNIVQGGTVVAGTVSDKTGYSGVVTGGTVAIVAGGTVVASNMVAAAPSASDIWANATRSITGGTVAIAAGGTTVASNYVAAPTIAQIAGTITAEHGAGVYGGGGGTVVVSGGTVTTVQGGTVVASNYVAAPTISQIAGTITAEHGSGAYGGGGVTLAEIAGTITADHGAGAYGAGGNGGTCVLTYTVYKPDSSLAAGAVVFLYSDINRTSLIQSQTANIHGVVTFTNLLASTYYLTSQLPPYPNMNDVEVVT